MMKLTIKEIEKRLLELKESGGGLESFLEELGKDSRTGVKKIISRHEKELMSAQLLKEKYEEMLIFELEWMNQGKSFIAGVDEVGRGPLAGPVVAAAVILAPGTYIPGVNDSKMLGEQRREELYEKIMTQAVAVGIGLVASSEIDQINIYQASKKAMVKAVKALRKEPDHLLIDAMEIPLPVTQSKIIKGDAKSVSIAAASIVAKVTRDRYMKELHGKYPHYFFHKNMGYGTKEHLQALEEHGPVDEHRRSFSPVGQGTLL
ncbi:ribonuclease HII [Fictibacillus fluitans]|uniref:Ribonuclease HII n=1 Tax=Fictibacillus fluitans TaxID=3058422 RepID=A0ABT8HRP0_9BACL|nr:ribonuclease HII [Fictibacillus sp. NE201]MDN4523439.1 ribonuclease HII [Fictibacillus sp. NE201]